MVLIKPLFYKGLYINKGLNYGFKSHRPYQFKPYFIRVLQLSISMVSQRLNHSLDISSVVASR